MRILAIATLCFILTNSGFAIPQTKRINAATANIPINFEWTSNSLVISEFDKPTLLMIDNRSASEVEVNCTRVGWANVPSASEGNSYWVNATTSMILDNPLIKGNCFIRSNTGSVITTGTVIIMVDGDN